MERKTHRTYIVAFAAMTAAMPITDVRFMTSEEVKVQPEKKNDNKQSLCSKQRHSQLWVRGERRWKQQVKEKNEAAVKGGVSLFWVEMFRAGALGQGLPDF